MNIRILLAGLKAQYGGDARSMRCRILCVHVVLRGAILVWTRGPYSP